MNPLSLRLRNVRSFEHLDIDLPSGTVALVGENGAGKSTLVNAIDTALFGPSGRSFRPALTRGAVSTELMVELVFEHAGETYRVRRGYSARGAGKSTVDLEKVLTTYDTSDIEIVGAWEPLTLGTAKETQARLEALLGFSRATFRASSFLVQRDASAFTLADPAVRKRILADALGLDRFEQLLAAVRRDRRAAEQEVGRIEGRLQGVTVDELASDRATLAALLATHEREIEAATTSLAAAERDLTEAARAVDEAKSAASARVAAVAACNAAVAALTAKVRIREEAEQARVQLETVKAELLALPTTDQLADYEAREADLAAVQTVYVEALREHEQTVALAEARAAEKKTIEAQASATHDRMLELDRKVRELEDQEHAACPTCEQTLGVEARKAAVGSLRAQAQLLADEAQALFERAGAIEVPDVHDAPEIDPKVPLALAAVRELLRAAREAEVARARLTERAAQLNERIDAGTNESYRQELAACEAAVREADEALAALPAAADTAPLEALAISARARVEAARTAQATASRDRAVIEERLAQLTARAAQHEQDLAARTTLQAEVDLLAILERAYGPDGIPALILENAAIPQLETEASRLLNLLGGPVSRVELRTDRAKQDGGIRDDVLDIVCATDSGDCVYDDLSGGEGFRVDVALRLALAQLLATRRGAEVKLLVIDEPDGLDASGKQALIEILRDLETRGGLERIYMISHDADLRDSFDQVIEVVKDESGRSRVEGQLEAVLA